MTDSDEDISISQNSKNHTGIRKLRLRNQVRIKLFYIILQLTLHSDDNNPCMADKLDQLFEIMHVKVFCYDRLIVIK